MSNKTSKCIRASYRLYDITDGNRELIEETSADQPFSFISGLGILLESFEKQVVDLSAGDEFDFDLTPEQAYGAYMEARVIGLDKQNFFVNGHFDDRNLYVDAVVPLQNEDGNRFSGRVIEITDEQVKVDLNHPLAGRTLNFKGKIEESREATNEEIGTYIESLSGHGGCGGDCGKHESGGGCCGKHHHDDREHHCQHGEGGCCGKHHHD